jgi:hypothetical protein
MKKFTNIIEIICFRIRKYKRYVKEISNILHLKTLKTFNKFDLKFIIQQKKY